jgi:hypothetical protein
MRRGRVGAAVVACFAAGLVASGVFAHRATSAARDFIAPSVTVTFGNYGTDSLSAFLQWQYPSNETAPNQELDWGGSAGNLWNYGCLASITPGSLYSCSLDFLHYGTTYHFDLRLKDSSGTYLLASTGDQTFTTPDSSSGTTTTTPPTTTTTPAPTTTTAPPPTTTTAPAPAPDTTTSETTTQATTTAPTTTTSAPTTTAPPVATTPKPKALAQKFKNCAELNKLYPHGVGRVGAHDRSNVRGAVVTNFTRNDAVYLANQSLDRDKDGIACEKK